jgi:hypothetical protein
MIFTWLPNAVSIMPAYVRGPQRWSLERGAAGGWAARPLRLG